MGFLEKLRPANATETGARSEPPAANTRVSNGLKEFLWLISDVRPGHLLDLGPVAQSTVSFFTDLSFRVYTEDLLRGWRDFLRAEEARMREAPVGTEAATSPAMLAENFLSGSLRYPDETFHAVLAWDIFDYLDAELLPRLAQRLHELVRPNGLLLAAFHASRPEGFHRYRVVDKQTIELVPAAPLAAPQRIFQNREILNLFSRFRTSKTFVGRDHLREALFTK